MAVQLSPIKNLRRNFEAFVVFLNFIVATVTRVIAIFIGLYLVAITAIVIIIIIKFGVIIEAIFDEARITAIMSVHLLIIFKTD